MSRAAAVAVVAALFVAGIAIGALGMHALDRPAPWAGRPDRTGPGPGFGRGPGGPGLLAPHIVERLELSDAQQERLTEVLEASRREGDAIRDELAPRLDALLERTRAEVDGILTPEQLAELERLRGGRGGRRWELLPGPGERRRRGPGGPRRR